MRLLQLLLLLRGFLQQCELQHAAACCLRGHEPTQRRTRRLIRRRVGNAALSCLHLRPKLLLHHRLVVPLLLPSSPPPPLPPLLLLLL